MRMNNRIVLWPTVCLAVLFACTGLADDTVPDRLPAPVLAALKQQRMPAGGMSVYVREIGSPLPLLAYGADTPRNPASTMKLLTTLVALERLGPAYAWKTEAYTSAPVRGGRMEGDLHPIF